MRQLYDTQAPRRAVNLSLNSDLVQRARGAKLNLSAIAEAAIRRALAEAAREAFLADIAVGVAHYEQYLAEYGSLGDAVRAMTLEDGE